VQGSNSQGVQGLQGTQGTSAQGTQGRQGTQAAQGAQGPTGTQGAAGTGGGSGLRSRTTASSTTSFIASNTSADLSITGFKGYVLYKIQTSAAAWVRLYTDSASRTSDASRSQTSDPLAGVGLIAEVITTGAQTQVMTPGVIGFNNDGTPATTIYARVTNLGGSSAAITVTLTLLQLEV
jgi:hypothetical protein